MAEPTAAQLGGRQLYVREAFPGDHPLRGEFARIEKVGEVKRKRGPLVIETYALDLLEGPKRDVLDRSPPPELALEDSILPAWLRR
jgi:hypothetical protein